MATLSTSYDVESLAKTTLKNTISPTQTVGIQINYALTITSGVLLFDPNTSREEMISFGSATVSGGVTTLGDVVRNLTKTLNDFSGSGTGFQHSGGSCVVELTNYHGLYNKKANVDRANSFTADQTIVGTKKWFFNDSDSYIYDNGTDIVFKSTAQAARTLSQLASLSGSNDKTKVSAADTTEGYLNPKLNFDQGLIASITNPGANEVLKLDIDLAVDPGLEFTANQLRAKVKAAGGVTLDSFGMSVDQSASFAWTGTHTFSGATMVDIEAITISDTIKLGENITLNQAVCIYGDYFVYQAQSDVLNDCFTVVGTARATGAAADTKKMNLFGPVVPISGLAANACKIWEGVSQKTSDASVPVYGANWYAQTFTMPASGQFRLDEVDLNLTKVLNPTGTYTLSVRAVDGGGAPTGGDLVTADSTHFR